MDVSSFRPSLSHQSRSAAFFRDLSPFSHLFSFYRSFRERVSCHSNGIFLVHINISHVTSFRPSFLSFYQWRSPTFIRYLPPFDHLFSFDQSRSSAFIRDLSHFYNFSPSTNRVPLPLSRDSLFVIFDFHPYFTNHNIGKALSRSKAGGLRTYHRALYIFKKYKYVRRYYSYTQILDLAIRSFGSSWKRNLSKRRNFEFYWLKDGRSLTL
jgi:hypothetical protein